MDKKNTMLLTVIAVATLLVAVVGATFAYFSVTGTNSTSTTTGTIQAASVVAPVFSSTDTAFGIYVTATDMANYNKNVSYYSKAGSITGTDSYYSTEADPHSILTVSVADSTTTSYTCTFTLTPTVTGSSYLTAGDATLHLTTSSGITGITADSDLTSISAMNGTVTLTGATDQTITGYLELVNTTDEQNFAGQTISVDLEVTVTGCSVDAA